MLNHRLSGAAFGRCIKAGHSRTLLSVGFVIAASVAFAAGGAFMKAAGGLTRPWPSAGSHHPVRRRSIPAYPCRPTHRTRHRLHSRARHRSDLGSHRRCRLARRATITSEDDRGRSHYPRRRRRAARLSLILLSPAVAPGMPIGARSTADAAPVVRYLHSVRRRHPRSGHPRRHRALAKASAWTCERPDRRRIAGATGTRRLDTIPA